MDISDKEKRIVDLFSNHDKRGARELYDAYAGYLTGVCARYLSAEDDLKDVVQESFISIFKAMPSFRYEGVGCLRAWITRITVNNALKYLRDKDIYFCPHLKPRGRTAG